MNPPTVTGQSLISAALRMTAGEVKKPVLQYQARRLRATAHHLKGARRKARWQVVAVHHLPAINNHCYDRVGDETFSHDDAVKVANTLNTLNSLPSC